MPRVPWTVYVLECRDGSLYTGVTNDLDRRVLRHQSGRGAAYTRSRLPVRVVYQEPARDKGAALRREAAIKKLTRLQKLALVSGSATPCRGRARPARAARSCPAARRRAR
jgi:putative endonuclease